ncbi:hypothetical protein [Enterococcus gallinarum]|uniref:hypothetical protein n=1 Tax=Enterococcus gallinarum TaxID=1353 RepID=UPI000AC3804C|nr:hypothetical protein [Enterococcus gallinarum]
MGRQREVLTNLLKDHFQLQVNPAFLQQMLVFLKQQKVDVYDEMTIMEFLQGIMDSGMLVERNDPYLTYSKVEEQILFIRRPRLMTHWIHHHVIMPM